MIIKTEIKEKEEEVEEKEAEAELLKQLESMDDEEAPTEDATGESTA